MAKTDMSEIVETTEKITEMDNGDGQDYSSIGETAASGFSALQSLEGAVGFTLAEPGQSEVMNQLLDVVNENVFDDNSSLEVNLGDNSSRRTSDVSSLSFQNIVLDDPEYDDQRIRSRLDSEDSTDSVHNLSRNYQGLDDDENCHLRAEHDNNLDLDVYKHRIMKLEEFPGTASSVDSKSDSPSDYELIKDAAATESAASVDMRSESDRASFSSREINIVQGLGHDYTPGDDSQVLSQLGIARTYDNGATSTTTASSVDRGGDSDVSDTASSVSNMDGCGRKRNSLEIRNNIPNANEVKLYNDSRNDDAVYYSNTARMKKKSPGLAKRMDYLDVTQNGAHGMNGAYNHLPNFGNYSANVGNNNLSSGLRSRSCSDSGSIRGDWERVKVNGVDIENEYDYVKFARIHQGDAYVGMRLAYSSSNDSLNHHQNSKESLNKNSGFYNSRGSQNSSPEKDAASSIAAEDGAGNTTLVLPSNSLSVVMSDDNLTEIPLNCDTTIENGDDNRKFTLSPEATECDSAEVESVISEGGRSSAGMPNVEDGLSSSATSDNEDMGHEPPITPAELLRKRHKADIESNMINPMVNLHQTKNIDSVVSHSHENLNIISRINVHDKISDYSQSLPRNGLSHQQRQDMYVQTRSNDFIAQDVLDLAMQDIKSAIRRSKSMTLKSTSYCNSTETMDHDCDSEPVWVKREISLDDNQQHLLRQEEMRLVREHIEQQEDDHDLKGDECKRKEFEKIDDEDDDDLINRQYIRNDGKKYHPAKGFDSDDDEFEDSHRPPCGQFARHIRSSKHYSKLPNEEANLDNSFSNLNSFVEKSETFLNNDVISSDQKSLNIRNTSLHHDIANSTNNLELKHHISSPSCEKSQYNKQYQKNKCHECSECDCDEATIVKGQEGAGIGEFDTDEETDQLLDKEYRREEKLDIPELSRPPVNRSAQAEKRRTRGKEGERQESLAISDPDEPTVLIEGVLFRARYLGSTQLISEGQPSKAMRMMQAQEAVGRIKTLGTLHFGYKYKAPEGDSQPSTEVDLFVSTEKIMVLNTDLQEIMMDHSLRTISYIADIGEIIVIMARRRMITSPGDEMLRRKKQSKIICHVFECEEAQLIAQSIGQAFQVAYMEFLKANGIEDPSLMKEMDYQEVLNQQEIFGEELSLFANRDTQKEVIVPKLKGEPLGVVIVESGWGSMVPTVVLANMSPTGAAARCGQLNIGDQIMSINGVSLVGLSLTSCQTYIKAAKNQTVVKLTVVQCPPVVEVLIKRPDVKYQLGFSVQNGVICSLLRGGIAERGGVRVGHRIIEINGSSVVAVAHEKIVSMLATSVGEIHMKTMPTSIYRLLTGQETPHYI